MTDTLTFNLNKWQFEGIGFDLSDDRVLQINQLLESLFDLAIFQYCAARIKPETRYKGYAKALSEFCNVYSIDEVAHLETLKQLEYRFRKSLEKGRKEAKIHPKLS